MSDRGARLLVADDNKVNRLLLTRTLELQGHRVSSAENTYYTLMFDAINGRGGVVNQMIGDGLMSIFGAPLPLADHAHQAVGAALDMVEMMSLFNTEHAAAGKSAIHIGIGICIGDTVNLAARLEAHTKLAQRGILIDAATARALPTEVAREALGPVAFKGKSAAAEVFAVVPPG